MISISARITLTSFLLAAFGGTAKADYVFTGLGAGPGKLVAASETWTYNFDGGRLEPDWGSPGISAGTVAYGEAQSAYGFLISFAGGAGFLGIDPASIATGNAAACVGSTNGGTTFCNTGSSTTVPWQAFQLTSTSIEFLAQSATFFEATSQNYFVNIFFKSGSALPTSFTGSWITSFSPNPTPEPSTFAMFGTGLVAAVLCRRYRSFAKFKMSGPDNRKG